MTATCTKSEQEDSTNKLPDDPGSVENLTLISPEEGAVPDTVKFITDTVFESNDSVFIEGYISDLAVDDYNRVYIAATAPGKVGVYVFDSDGSYLKKIGRFGRGPGEFEAIPSIDILGNELILLDSRLQKFVIYSLNTFEILAEETIKLNGNTGLEMSKLRLRGLDVSLKTNDEIVLKIGNTSLTEDNDGKKFYYYLMKRDGTIGSDVLLSVKKHKRYYYPDEDIFAVPITKPFNRSSLVSIDSSGSIFTLWTDEFLINTFDSTGRQQRALSYPYQKSDFALDQIAIADHERRMLRGEIIPDQWPAVHTMELDDEGRLWVATITDSKSKYTWWVISKAGDLLARFTKSGKRASRSVIKKPIIVIKNGHFYSHERDLRQGIDRIVKHRIEFVSMGSDE